LGGDLPPPYFDMKNLIYLASLFIGLGANAQYPPPAGQNGSTAIESSSAQFVAWATSCAVVRGYMDISTPDSGFASVGDESMATGEAGNGIISLGDNGQAVLQFALPITNGPGFDFAIFENSFSDDFLELAFVEVSSNGTDFFRFPAVSLSPTDVQTASFGSTDATKINNLAGKYRAGFGTPFDLNELSGIEGLDINHITHVKIIDVVGNIDPIYARYDSQQNIINDPWPTRFPSGGFDLDAVGVIHNTEYTSILEYTSDTKLFGNPLSENSHLYFDKPVEVDVSVFDVNGKKVAAFSESNSKTINLGGLKSLYPGPYVLVWKTSDEWGQMKIIRE